jgi:chromate transporter
VRAVKGDADRRCPPERAHRPPGGGSPLEVLFVFLRLGLTSFGGPIAHIGYFRNAFVLRRKWLDENDFADLVGLCQFLPGPASSQVGFSIGLMRAGWLGALGAWTGFTLPSAALMVLFAYGAGGLHGPLGEGLIHGLKLVAVAIVGQAVWGMARTLTPDVVRGVIAVAAAVILLGSGWAFGQVAVIAAGAVLGLLLCRGSPPAPVGRLAVPVSKAAGILALAAYAVLLIGLPVLARGSGSIALARFDAFYRAGALVFGGGHVVLPLLRQTVATPGWVSQDAFLAGYGAAQAVPGPLFTFAAYLGAAAKPGPHGIAGGALGLFAIFLPGLLALVGALPFWDGLRRVRAAQAAMRGVNAAVVGVLGAAFYNPVWTSSVRTLPDLLLALAAFLLLTRLRAPPIAAVALCAAGGAALAALG